MTDANSLAYQNLQPDDILDAVEALGFQCDGRMLALNSYENRVYQVGQHSGKPLVAKFYRPGRWTDAAILEEHAFSAELSAAEIPVLAPLEHKGSTLFRHREFRFALTICHGGRAPELDNLELLAQLGRLVGRIHLIGETKQFVHRPTLDMQSFGIDSCRYLLDNRFIPGDLIESYTSTCENLFAHIEDCYARAEYPQAIRLHGDFHPGNVLVNQDRLHIVDLDDARSGPAVQDLWMFLSGNREEQTPQLEALLGGYSEFRRFAARELHLIEALRSLRILHYAAWLARRHEDPAFKIAFPWFNSPRYWEEHILSLKEQLSLLQEPPLQWLD
jgi:Ser/Thr protein kinase RdoA (MazF antagonist)